MTAVIVTMRAAFGFTVPEARTEYGNLENTILNEIFYTIIYFIKHPSRLFFSILNYEQLVYYPKLCLTKLKYINLPYILL